MYLIVEYRKNNNEKYDEQCEKNRQIALKRWGKNTNECDRIRTNTNDTDKIRLDKNRIDKNRVDNKEKSIKEKDAAKAAAPVKHKYGEYNNVLLTDEELDKLIAEFPDYQKRIENLSNYIASTGKKYKNHYATIKNWARRDGEKQNVKGAKAQELDSFYEMAQRWAESED